MKEYSSVHAKSRTEFGPGNVQWGADWQWHLRNGPGGGGKKVRVVPFFEENNLGNDRLLSLTSAHRNVMV